MQRKRTVFGEHFNDQKRESGPQMRGMGRRVPPAYAFPQKASFAAVVEFLDDLRAVPEPPIFQAASRSQGALRRQKKLHKHRHGLPFEYITCKATPPEKGTADLRTSPNREPKSRI
jgi:hypothetical protein